MNCEEEEPRREDSSNTLLFTLPLNDSVDTSKTWSLNKQSGHLFNFEESELRKSNSSAETKLLGHSFLMKQAFTDEEEPALYKRTPYGGNSFKLRGGVERNAAILCEMYELLQKTLVTHCGLVLDYLTATQKNIYDFTAEYCSRVRSLEGVPLY